MIHGVRDPVWKVGQVGPCGSEGRRENDAMDILRSQVSIEGMEQTESVAALHGTAERIDLARIYS